MKKATKILALVLTVVLAAGVLCGCGGSKLPREMGRYSYWVSVDSRAAATINSYEDMLMYQEMEKRTGIKIDFIHPSKGSTGNEAFQILLTSNDIPDMVEYNWASYPGGADKAIQDGIIISLNDYMEECAPNYYALMEGTNLPGTNAKHKNYHPQYKVEVMTLGGNYYGFKELNVGQYRGFGGLYIRKDILDKWGMEVPTTIDDWSAILKKAKDEGFTKPLTGGASLFSLGGLSAFNGAWHVGKTYHIDDNGEVQLSLADPKYKEYVSKMAEWYKAGYIDPDYLNVDSETIMGNMTSGASIATFGYVGGGIGKLLAAMDEEYKAGEFVLAACPYPVLIDGEESWFQELYNETNSATIAITTMCGSKNADRYKEAMKWCDNFYSEEGELLKNFGVKGHTFDTIEVDTDEQLVDSDGNPVVDSAGNPVYGKRTKYVYTATINDPNEYKKFNAQSVEAALYHFFRPAGAPGFSQHDDYLDGFYPYQEQKDGINTWNAYIEAARAHQLPSILQYTEEETNTNNKIVANNVTNDFDAIVNDIIMGKKSISEYDKALADARKAGYDELLEIRRAAYKRFVEGKAE